MTDLPKEVLRGKQAQEILENPLVVEALDLIRSNIILSWESAKVAENPEREKAWMMLKALNEFKRFFETIVKTGQLAQHELTLLEKTQQKVKSIWRNS